MATFGATMIDEEERPVDSGVIPKTYTTVRVNQNHLLYHAIHTCLYITCSLSVCKGPAVKKYVMGRYTVDISVREKLE